VSFLSFSLLSDSHPRSSETDDILAVIYIGLNCGRNTRRIKRSRIVKRRAMTRDSALARRRELHLGDDGGGIVDTSLPGLFEPWCSSELYRLVRTTVYWYAHVCYAMLPGYVEIATLLTRLLCEPLAILIFLSPGFGGAVQGLDWRKTR